MIAGFNSCIEYDKAFKMVTRETEQYSKASLYVIIVSWKNVAQIEIA